MANGGIIGVINTPTPSAASGVWTLEEHFLARSADIWPLAIPSVVLTADVWLDASDATTITEAGGAVSQWDNKGSLGNFAQGTAALQPTTGASTQNGFNVIDFAADYLTSADTAATYKFMHDGTNYLICAVVKPSSAAKGGILGNNADSSGNVGAAWIYRGDQTANSGEALIVRGQAGTSVVSLSSSSMFNGQNFIISTAEVDPDNGTAANRWKQYLNGGTAITTNAATGAVSTANPTYVLQLGALGNNANPFTGSIAELVIVSGADATDANRVLIRDYLNAKWNVY